MPDIEEGPVGPRPPRDDAPGLERPLRTDMDAPEASLPSLVDHAIRCPVVLMHSASDASVFLPLGAHDRLRAQVPRATVVGAQSDPDG